MEPNDGNEVGGQATITMDSFLFCALGALIVPLSCGQGFVSPYNAEKPNPATGSGSPDAQSKNHWCWAACASIMARDKLGGKLKEETNKAISKYIQAVKEGRIDIDGNIKDEYIKDSSMRMPYYYQTADEWTGGGNGILGLNAAYTKGLGYNVDDIQNYLNAQYGSGSKNISVSQEQRNKALEDLTGCRTEMVGTVENGNVSTTYFLNQNGEVDEKKAKEFLDEKLRHGGVIADAYRIIYDNTGKPVDLDTAGGGHSYVIRKRGGQNIDAGEYELFDPYTGASLKSMTIKKLFEEGFTGDIFAGDPQVRIAVLTGFVE